MMAFALPALAAIEGAGCRRGSVPLHIVPPRASPRSQVNHTTANSQPRCVKAPIIISHSRRQSAGVAGGKASDLHR
jgi:hypothetical protein